MEAVSVRCNHCGAPLTVGEKTRFVTCQFCNCQLEVKRTDSSIFTEEVSKIADHTEKMADSLEVIKLQNEIERVDREWQAQQPVSSPRAGGRHPGPSSAGGSIFGVMFAIFFAVVCFSIAGFATSNGAPGLFGLVPVGMGVFAVVGSLVSLGKSSQLRQKESDYQQQRGELLGRLDALKKR